MEPLSTICYLYTSKLTMNSLLVNYRGRDADVLIIGFTLITDHLATLHITITHSQYLGYWDSQPFGSVSTERHLVSRYTFIL